MANPFEYQTLDRSRREIRLLSLLPVPQSSSRLSSANGKKKEQQPACELSKSSLDQNPAFVALSYVWGDQSDRQDILVDNRPWSVTRNLFDALSELREAGEVMVVWVDAICIDQANEEEKGWQVELMGDIYRQASKVIAWLGPTADESDAAVDYLEVLGRQAEVCGMDSGGPDAYAQIWQAMESMPSYMDDPRHPVVFTVIKGRMLPVSKGALKRLFDFVSGLRTRDQRDIRDGLKRFFRRAWWGRIWVLQEIALPQSAVFACGSKRITRRRLRAAFNAYHTLCITLSMKNPKQDREAFESLWYFPTTHRPMVMLSMSYIYRMEDFPLVALLRATCVFGIHILQEDGLQHLESTDSRDKIFALLGLAKDREQLKALGVFPDYTKSKREAYVTTMMALLKQGHFPMLSFCRATETSKHLLPSWVLDWSLPLPETLQDVRNDHVTLFPEFNASGSNRRNQIYPPEFPQFGRLSVASIVYDEVSRVPRVTKPGTSIPEFDWLAGILQLTYDADCEYVNFKARLQAVIRTSHAAIGYTEYNSMDKVDRFYDALPTFQKGVAHIKRREIRNQLRSYLNNKETKALLGDGGGDPDRLRRDIMRITPRRSPFVTKKGHLGLSFEFVRQDDVVAVIGGAQVPFVLRPCHSGGFRIIGEAYVDEIMDGEATEDGRWEYIDLV